MRIQYFSDIHLEFGSLEVVPTDADVVVAAGDIGIGRQGLDWLKSFRKPVVYVAGNHEFYSQEHLSTLANLSGGAGGSNVQFLERRAWEYNGVRFLGCTLWSDLGGEDNDQLQELVSIVNDFRKIRYRADTLSAESYLQLHRESRHWLFDELAKPFPGKTVVVTHHAPTPWSWRDNPGHLKRYAYCNDLKEVLHSFEIAAWFHGHTHAVSDYRCAGTRILCNPRGYFPNQLVSEFDPGKVLEI
ncbi:metallophosphoesterase [Methylocaldum sp.]|uniref:metallophosphoesterase n=1 Tax=Methylocaldum sp. TaxID=1969727 RepID=UPI002D75CE30|nr:metallophosphoesterase [Methylocaldum sp.]HYE36474.1 metallophosphoesterase [Methylocaldum sp.]